MLSSANDPRLPAAARSYKAPLVSPEDLPVDYSGFLAVLCGAVGVMVKYTVESRFALICCAQSLANMRNMENDLKQIFMALIGNADEAIHTLLRIHDLSSCSLGIRGGYAEALCVQENRKPEGERMKNWASAAWKNCRLSLAGALDISEPSSKIQNKS